MPTESQNTRYKFAKQQACIFLKILNAYVDISIDEKEFLTVWARSAGYENWEAFMVSFGEEHISQHRLILKPDSIDDFAQSIAIELAHGEVGIELVASILKNVTSSAEKALFGKIEKLPEPETAIKICTGPETKYDQDYLLFLWNYCVVNGRITKSLAEELYLREMKNKRLLSRSQNTPIDYLDVYESKGVTAGFILESLVVQGYVEVVGNNIVISQLGGWWMRDLLTKGYDDEWKTWFKQLREKVKENGSVSMPKEWDQIIQYYHFEISPEECIERLKTPDWVVRKTQKVKSDISSILSIDEKNLINKRIFHFIPVFRLARGETINKLEISSCEVNLSCIDLKLGKPYYNKTYVVASADKRQLGVFFEIPDGMDEFCIVLTWHLSSGDVVVHNRFFDVSQNKNKGWLFSDEVARHLVGPYSPAEIKPYSFRSIEAFTGAKRDEDTWEDAAKKMPRMNYSIKSLKLTTPLSEINEYTAVDGQTTREAWALSIN